MQVSNLIHDKFLILGWFLSLFFFAFGLQVGFGPSSTYNIVQQSSHSEQVCPNGNPVSSYNYHLKSLSQKGLFDLGDQGRSMLKKCMCQGFESGICVALRTEVNDSLDL